MLWNTNQTNLRKELRAPPDIEAIIGPSIIDTHFPVTINQDQERSGIGWIMNGTDWELKNKTIRERLLGNKDEMNQSDIQCYGTLTKQICVKNYVPLQTLKRSLVHQSLIPISPLQSIND
eukprot:826578_1